MTVYAAAISPVDDFSARATAWLETLAADLSGTIRDTPRSTILPAAGNSTAGGRAMAALAGLEGDAHQLRTLEVIGEGGMGVIREAEQVALGRIVAVKTLKANRREPAAALDLLREAWVTGSIEHPNVVPVHYVELDEHGHPVIVLKRIAGVEWSKLLTDPETVTARFGTTDVLAWNLGILLHVLNAVRFAHSKGIIHRDLKPSNVMVGDFGEVYLLDWGIAVSLRDDGSGRMALASNATELAGTPCYMAPEMLGRENGPPISERTDVYLAGSVLFELITGRPPHGGDTAPAVIASVIESAPVLPPEVPVELAKICMRAMHADPENRFESIDAMRIALQSYLEHRGSAQLGARASLRLDELLAVLANPAALEPTTTAELEAAEAAEIEHREAIYRLFGACRFGCLEALAVWRDNVDAQACLARATVAVAEYELAAGNSKAAVTLLGDLADAPPALVARARQAADAETKHQAALEKLRVQHDPLVGRRTRAALAGVLGVTFSILPLIDGVYPSALPLDSHLGNVLWALGVLVIVLGVTWYARDSMRATLFNRRVAATGVFIFVGQTVLSLGAWAVGLSVEQSQTLMIFFWGTIATGVAINLDPWVAPSAAFYYAAFLFAARMPEYRLFAMSASNLVFGINAVIRWRPATLMQTPEERAWLERAKRTRRYRHW